MIGAVTVFARGTTVFFSATFYDVNNFVVQPSSATINIVYPASGGTATASVSMTAPTAPAIAWIGEWDSRGSGIGAVSWFLYSDPGPPFGVAEGELILTGNPANLATFS
jgi:hypothetical protein